MQKRPFIALAFPFAFAAWPALADDAKELPTVNVTGAQDKRTLPLDAPAATGSRLGIPLKEIPASIEVIGQETLRERGDRTVVEATEKAAGFTGGVTGGTPGAFSVRGFTNNGVAWLYNGVRVPGGSGMSARVMDTANFDRIEVLRGPASVLNGEGSIGATVNLISRAPSFVRQPFEVDYALGRFDSHRLHAGAGGPLKEGVAAYRLDLSASRFGSAIRGERTDLGRLTGAVLFRLNERLNLTLELDKLYDSSDRGYWGTPLVNGQLDKTLRRVNYNNLDNTVQKADTTWLRANLEWFATPDVEIRNQFYYFTAQRDWRNVESYRYNPGPIPTVTRSSWGELDHRHDMIGNRLEGVVKGTLGTLDHRLLVGADISRTDFSTRRNGFPGSQTVDAFNPPSANFYDFGIPMTPARKVAINQWALFAENQLVIRHDFKLLGGVRHDRFDTAWIYRDQAGSPEETKTHAFTSWRAGAVIDLTPATTLYASWATAVEPGGSLLLLNRNQSQLDLTTAKQIEAGLKQSFWNNKGEWTAAVYDIQKKNVFVPDPAQPANRLPVGKQSSQGIELSLGLRPAAHWQIDANLAALRARYDDYSTGNPPVSRSGNTPPFVPKFVANLGLRYLPTADWRLGAWLRHVAKVYADDANQTRLPGYTTLDLSADYTLNKQADLSLRIRNVTDAFYATWAYGANQVVIANPRSIELAARLRF